jgi:hypothetical protein
MRWSAQVQVVAKVLGYDAERHPRSVVSGAFVIPVPRKRGVCGMTPPRMTTACQTSELVRGVFILFPIAPNLVGPGLGLGFADESGVEQVCPSLLVPFRPVR